MYLPSFNCDVYSVGQRWKELSALLQKTCNFAPYESSNGLQEICYFIPRAHVRNQARSDINVYGIRNSKAKTFFLSPKQSKLFEHVVLMEQKRMSFKSYWFA